MKKKEGAVLHEKLFVAVNKVLRENNSCLTNKIEKVIKKSIRKIVKKTDKRKENI